MDMQQHPGLKNQGVEKDRRRSNQGLCEQGHHPSPSNIVRLLKTCAAKKDIHKGSKLHEYIREHNYIEKNTYIGNTLVSMYAKCGALAKARLVLKELPMHDVVSWSALIAGYAQQGQGEEALRCFDDMLCEGHSPNAVTFACVLRACGSIQATAKGEEIHDKIVSLGILEKDIVLGNALIGMYAKCGELAKAYQVLKELAVHDVVSWSALIAGYVQHGQGKEALRCFDDMLCEGHPPDAVTFACVLKACGSIRATAKGEEIHGKIVTLDMLAKDIVLGNTLIDMYAKCDKLAKAYQVLKELCMQDVVSWNALIAGYVQHGQAEEAFKCFDDMLHEGHSPNSVTFTCVLKASGSIGGIAKGEEIHEKIVGLGMLEKDIVLGNTLVHMYAKCGEVVKAHRVFRKLPMHDVVSWTALIAGHAQEGQGEEALKCFNDMLYEGHTPNAYTFACVLKACGSIGAAAKGEEVHNTIVSLGILEKNVVLGIALVDMYAKCSELAKAHRLLCELPMRDIVSWNALIAGYAQHRQGEEALKCFNDMLCEGHFPDAITFACVLRACGSIGATTKGEEIHDKIVSLGMLEKDIVLGNTLVDMYVKCGEFAKAHKVVKELPMHDVVMWTALIAGHAQQGQGVEALKCFDDMLCEEHSPNAVTFACALKACGSIGGTAKGEGIHYMIVSLGIMEKNFVLGIALVDMYMKCGAVAKAQQVLEELPICHTACWSTLIAGYAHQGLSVEAINCFQQMQSNGVEPDLIGLTVMLNACGHSGLLDQAETYFSGMSEKYGIHPCLEHYCCMIDVFGRAGKFSKALSLIAEMPNNECLSNWVALLGACHKWAEMEIATLAFDRALNLDQCNAAVYVLMLDIYTTADMQEAAHAIEVMRMANKAWENPGYCW